ncbi:peptidoglycan editing factor PgeF [Endothiovibrio diazotrophicus]
MNDFLLPNWPAPATVRAAVTTRLGGVSARPYDSFNLATHVEDDPRAVAVNRARLREALGLPAEPCWLNQIHGTGIVDAAAAAPGCEADGAFATVSGVVCVVMTADCLPVLLCDLRGRRVAAVHAGWRGLLDGVVEAAVARLERPGEGLMAWLGPAIGPAAFEVGDEVRDAFLADDPGCVGAFRPSPAGRWLADLYHLACRRLARIGIDEVYGGGLCTYRDAGRFYSYRRDGRTGRMASLIWLESR